MRNRTLRLSLQVGFVYAEEADVLNVALFGMTAKEWREKNPEEDKEGNIRDYADLLHLIILNNLENINAELIEIGMKLRNICMVEKIFWNRKMQLVTKIGSILVKEVDKYEKMWYYKTEKCNWLQKYSLKEESVTMEIKREYYLEKLIKRQNNGLILCPALFPCRQPAKRRPPLTRRWPRARWR